jgi:hypothetical protein
MDLWTAVRRHLLGTPPPDYAMVGRWIGHMARGTFRHARIAAAPAVRGDARDRLGAHYAIGVAFAAVLVVCSGFDWLLHPTLVPAARVGIATVAAPFFLMQPGVGAGIAARKPTRPLDGALQSLVTTPSSLRPLPRGARREPFHSTLKEKDNAISRTAMRPIVFGALLSAIMVCFVTAVVLALNRGLGDGFAWQWLKSCADHLARGLPHGDPPGALGPARRGKGHRLNGAAAISSPSRRSAHRRCG